MSNQLVLVTVLLLAAVSFYVYSAMALMTIARKTDTPKSWLAWIPLANLYLMTCISRISGWWSAALVISAAFLPVGPLIFGVVTLAPVVDSIATFLMFTVWMVLPYLAFLQIWVFLWWKIAEARSKPGWHSLLMLIPAVNLVVLGFFAWRD